MRREWISLLLLGLLPACGGSDGAADMITGPAGVSDFVRSLDSPTALAVDADAVYWADRFGYIFKASKTKAERYMVIDTHGAIINRLAVDKTHLFWAAAFPPGVASAPKDGGTPTTLATLKAGMAAVGLALDDQYVYFTSGSGGDVMRVTRMGTDLQVIAHDAGTFGQVVVDGTHAFYENSYVYRVLLAGGVTPTQLDGPKGGPAALALAGDQVYEWLAVIPDGDAVLSRIPTTTGMYQQVGSAKGKAIDMVIEGSSAFCIAGSDIVQIPLDGGAPTIVAKEEADPRHIAADAGAVYWTTVATLRRSTR